MTSDPRKLDTLMQLIAFIVLVIVLAAALLFGIAQ